MNSCTPISESPALMKTELAWAGCVPPNPEAVGLLKPVLPYSWSPSANTVTSSESSALIAEPWFPGRSFSTQPSAAVAVCANEDHDKASAASAVTSFKGSETIGVNLCMGIVLSFRTNPTQPPALRCCRCGCCCIELQQS